MDSHEGESPDIREETNANSAKGAKSAKNGGTRERVRGIPASGDPMGGLRVLSALRVRGESVLWDAKPYQAWTLKELPAPWAPAFSVPLWV